MLVTNIVVDKHNIWTLTKHVAGSVNKAAATTDKAVYGTQQKVVVKDVPEPHPVRDTLFAIGGAILIAAVLFAYMIGAIKGRDLIGF